MNKKRLSKKIGTSVMLLTLVASLSSCSILFDIMQDFLENDIDDIIGNITNDYASYREIDAPEETLNFTKEEGKAGYNISLIDEKYNEGYEILPSTGNQKVLVIPVYFKDYTPFSCFDDPIEALENINTAFFGESEDTGWESVKSYYEKSSYGKFILEGMVTSWCPIDKTLEEFVTLKGYNDPSIYALREAVKWSKNTYPNIEKEYDQDKDGYIDSVVLVYANDYYSSLGNQTYDRDYSSKVLEDIESVLWAYTYWDYEEEPNYTSPIGNVYSWLSYSFLFDGEYHRVIKDGLTSTKEPLVDTHTFVHEFGHILGLDDYYSYDILDDEPLGKLDMMDNNIGDHNAYSKYLLNWINPTLVEKEGQYTISTLGIDGNNALLIPADLQTFNYSPFNEYLLIELYTPDNLNELDSKDRYKGGSSSIPYHFTKMGVKILHVDSRLVVADTIEETYYYTNVFNDTREHPSKVQFIGPNNTSSYSIDPDFKLINLISSEKGRNAFDNNYYATNRDLFVLHDMITEFEFNNGASLQYNIEVINFDKTNQTVTIEITNK